MKNLYLDINVLQSVPSSNINRDDTGAPKTAIYGGVTRARVSSQSWKRAIRLAFKEESKSAPWLQSSRTLKVPELLASELQNQDSSLSDEDAIEKSVAILKAAGIKAKKDKKTGLVQTSALLLISQGQLNALAKYVLNNDDFDKKEIKKLFNSENALDLALFGRMVADNPELNVDAACQVAHAISTHEVTPEFDYYTAVDDEKSKDQAGSAMIGSLEYNSSTLYRYANINLNELQKNLGKKLMTEGIKLFIKDFISTMPTGKENTFANKTLPQYVLITLRDDTPVNLVSVFEDPIKSRDGYVEKSIVALESEYKSVEKFVDKPLFTEVLTSRSSEINKQTQNLNELIRQTADEVAKRADNDENTND